MTLRALCAHWAAPSKPPACQGAAASWIPNGNPSSLIPDGMTMVGRPLEVHGDWNAASPVVFKSLGAGAGVAGVNTTS